MDAGFKESNVSFGFVVQIQVVEREGWNLSSATQVELLGMQKSFEIIKDYTQINFTNRK